MCLLLVRCNFTLHIFSLSHNKELASLSRHFSSTDVFFSFCTRRIKNFSCQGNTGPNVSHLFILTDSGCIGGRE